MKVGVDICLLWRGIGVDPGSIGVTFAFFWMVLTDLGASGEAAGCARTRRPRAEVHMVDCQPVCSFAGQSPLMAMA